VPLVNAALLNTSLGAAPGVKSARFSNSGASALKGPVEIGDLGAFLAAGNTLANASPLTVTLNADGGELSLKLDLAAGTRFASLLSPELSDALTALLAPVASGDPMSEKEYLAFVGSVYGMAVRREIEQSSVDVLLELPGTVTMVSGSGGIVAEPTGGGAGRQVKMTCWLASLLVLERPAELLITWKKGT
jgi:hypothetical protein